MMVFTHFMCWLFCLSSLFSLWPWSRASRELFLRPRIPGHKDISLFLPRKGIQSSPCNHRRCHHRRSRRRQRLFPRAVRCARRPLPRTPLGGCDRIRQCMQDRPSAGALPHAMLSCHPAVLGRGELRLGAHVRWRGDLQVPCRPAHLVRVRSPPRCWWFTFLADKCDRCCAFHSSECCGRGEGPS